MQPIIFEKHQQRWSIFFHERYRTLCELDNAQWEIAQKYWQANKQLPKHQKVRFRSQRAAWLKEWGFGSPIYRALRKQAFYLNGMNLQTPDDKPLLVPETWKAVHAEQVTLRIVYQHYFGEIPISTRRRCVMQIGMLRLGYTGLETTITPKQFSILAKEDLTNEAKCWSDLRKAHDIFRWRYQDIGSLPLTLVRRMAFEYENFWLELHPELATYAGHPP